ncbi:MAG TPA: DNA topoisomerase IB [Candidatus Angelobacter sp.]|nr:DNA topoisomerase IB [Candidatus Angelobacter sp.]
MTVAAAGPVATAKYAGLRYVTDSIPGISRTPQDGGFAYVNPDGTQVGDAEEIQRIHHLAIPPAWTGVWICPYANGHLQATGRDARRRKQYRYHEKWRVVRDEVKYERTVDFGRALPRIRRQVEIDLRLPGLPRDKVLAAVVRILDTTAMRVGNEEYARENNHYGLTTLHSHHASVHGATVKFEFVGKSGKKHAVEIEDPRLARIVRQCQELPGHELFQYVDSEGNDRDVSSEDVNEHLHRIAGDEFTAKDFRTWDGTVMAACFLRELGPVSSEREGRRLVKEAIDRVAKLLGNTPAIARKCYVHPDVIDAYMDGSLLHVRMHAPLSPRGTTQEEGLRDEERAVLRLLQKRRLHGAAATA